MNVRKIQPPGDDAEERLAREARELPLAHGRRLALVSGAGDDLVEIRGEGGALELRIRLTPGGPVLQMESLKLSLKSARDVEVECANFAVRAREGMELASDGALRIQGEADVHMDANGEVRVRGAMIHLN